MRGQQLQEQDPVPNVPPWEESRLFWADGGIEGWAEAVSVQPSKDAVV
jgi:hypothetical protein